MEYQIKTFEDTGLKAKKLSELVSALLSEIVQLEKNLEQKTTDHDKCMEIVSRADKHTAHSLLIEMKKNEELALTRKIEATSCLSRKRNELRREQSELGKLNALINAESNLAEAECRLKKSWQKMESSKKTVKLLKSKQAASVEKLEECKKLQAEGLDEAIRKEIETGKESAVTQKKNRALLDEIEIQKRRVELFATTIPEKDKEYKAAKAEYEKSRSAYLMAKNGKWRRSSNELWNYFPLVLTNIFQRVLRLASQASTKEST